MDTAGPDRAIYKGEKSLGVYSFTGQGVVSQKPSDASTKNALSLVTRCSAGQILVQTFTKFDSPQQTVPTKNLFFLAVCTHEVLLCAPSFVTVVSTTSYRVLIAKPTPYCIP